MERNHSERPDARPAGSAKKFAHSVLIKLNISITKTLLNCAAIFRSARRLCRAA